MENEYKKTILVVDDDEVIRDIITEFIVVHFPAYDVKSFEDGGKLEELILEDGLKGVKLILTDNNMPIIPGIEIIKKYSNKIIKEGIPVILMSGIISDELTETALKSGVYRVLQKPIKFEKLANIIDEAIQNYSY